MELNNKINKFPSYLSDMLKDAIYEHKPVRNDGIFFLRKEKKSEYEQFVERSKFTQRDIMPF